MARTIGLAPAQAGAEAEERPTCPHCGKEYRSVAALRAHVRKEHPQSFDETDPDGELE